MEQKRLKSKKRNFKKTIINIFIKKGKKSNLEYSLYKLIKKLKKKTLQKPYFFIYNQLKKLFIGMKIEKLYLHNSSEQQDESGYFLKKINIHKQLKNSIKLLMSNKKNINLFFYNINNLNFDSKKKIFLNIEQNKFNILKYVI